MKTKYETPEMNLLLLDVQDVIVTSTSTGLKKNDIYDTTSDVTTGTWGSLWG